MQALAGKMELDEQVKAIFEAVTAPYSHCVEILFKKAVEDDPGSASETWRVLDENRKTAAERARVALEKRKKRKCVYNTWWWLLKLFMGFKENTETKGPGFLHNQISNAIIALKCIWQYCKGDCDAIIDSTIREARESMAIRPQYWYDWDCSEEACLEALSIDLNGLSCILLEDIDKSEQEDYVAGLKEEINKSLLEHWTPIDRIEHAAKLFAKTNFAGFHSGLTVNEMQTRFLAVANANNFRNHVMPKAVVDEVMRWVHLSRRSFHARGHILQTIADIDKWDLKMHLKMQAVSFEDASSIEDVHMSFSKDLVGEINGWLGMFCMPAEPSQSNADSISPSIGTDNPSQEPNEEGGQPTKTVSEKSDTHHPSAATAAADAATAAAAAPFWLRIKNAVRETIRGANTAIRETAGSISPSTGANNQSPEKGNPATSGTPGSTSGRGVIPPQPLGQAPSLGKPPSGASGGPPQPPPGSASGGPPQPPPQPPSPLTNLQDKILRLETTAGDAPQESVTNDALQDKPKKFVTNDALREAARIINERGAARTADPTPPDFKTPANQTPPANTDLGETNAGTALIQNLGETNAGTALMKKLAAMRQFTEEVSEEGNEEGSDWGDSA